MPICPTCGSSDSDRDGLRYLNDGSSVQRWLCRNCGYRFSKSKKKINITSQIVKPSNSGDDVHEVRITSRDCSFKETSNDLSLKISEDVGSHNPSDLSTVEKRLKPLPNYNRYTKVCVSKGETKNLEPTARTKTVVGDKERNTKGTIIDFMWQLQREGKASTTIKTYAHALESLIRKGAILDDSENVKDVIARSNDWTISRKYNITKAYTTYLRLQGRKWEKPKYHPIPKLPFIPTEKEIDSLVAGCSRQVSTFLQLLKETSIRAGEAIRMEWTDLDLEKKTVRISPEKGSNPRMLKISNRLVSMLDKQPKKNKRIFSCTTPGIGNSFRRQRRRISYKLNNPRLLQIHFHTLRHWKATMEYQKTKDILHVKQMLGHKRLETTLIYTQMVVFQDDEYTCKVAKTVKEATELIEAGFQYITEIDGNKLFRKRK